MRKFSGVCISTLSHQRKYHKYNLVTYNLRATYDTYMLLNDFQLSRKEVKKNFRRKVGTDARSYTYSVAHGFLRKLLRAEANSAPFWSPFRLIFIFAILQIISLIPIILTFLRPLQSSE